AIVAFRKAIELDPKSANAYGNLGFALANQGKLDEAIAAYEKGLAADPEFTSNYNGFAWMLVTCRDEKFRDPARAAALARKAVELEPGNANYFNTLGVTESRAGNWQAAVEALTRSISLRGGSVDASADWLFLAMAHWQLGNKTEASQWYDKAITWTK